MLKKNELRVLQVFSSLGMGGAETWLIALLRYFADNAEHIPFRIQTDICLTGGVRSVFDHEAESLGARLFYLRYTRKTLPRFIREFRTLLRRGDYDVVHDHQDYTAGWHFAFGAGVLPAIRIAHVHNPFLPVAVQRNASIIRSLTTAAGKHLVSLTATTITGTSQYILDKYGLGCGHTPSSVVHCGFDVSRYSGDYERAHTEVCGEFGWPTSAKVILFVGRLDGMLGPGVNHKNPSFALDVAKEVVR